MSESGANASLGENARSSAPAFREKSLDHIGSAQSRHAYLKGSGRMFWMAIVAFVLIVAAVAVWGALASPGTLLGVLFHWNVL